MSLSSSGNLKQYPGTKSIKRKRSTSYNNDETRPLSLSRSGGLLYHNPTDELVGPSFMPRYQAAGGEEAFEGLVSMTEHGPNGSQVQVYRSQRDYADAITFAELFTDADGKNEVCFSEGPVITATKSVAYLVVDDGILKSAGTAWLVRKSGTRAVFATARHVFLNDPVVGQPFSLSTAPGSKPFAIGSIEEGECWHSEGIDLLLFVVTLPADMSIQAIELEQVYCKGTAVHVVGFPSAVNWDEKRNEQLLNDYYRVVNVQDEKLYAPTSIAFADDTTKETFGVYSFEAFKSRWAEIWGDAPVKTITVGKVEKTGEAPCLHTCNSHRGMSGGPVLTAEGKVIGVHVAIDAATRLNKFISFSQLPTFCDEAKRLAGENE